MGFAQRIAAVDPLAGRAAGIEALMLNVGRRCDLACAHCHHRCTPDSTESMSQETMLSAIELATKLRPGLVDVTGGAPELWPHIRELIALARAAGLPVRVRTNLLALARSDSADLPALFANERVSLVATLQGVDPGAAPAVDAGASSRPERALEMLRTLASLGYGAPDGPVLEIAHNPPSGELPRTEAALQEEYAAAFASEGVRFTRVMSIANVPLGRFADGLERDGGVDAYTRRLAAAFNPLTVSRLACRRSVEVAWDGRLYDCDFNLAAGLPLADGPSTLAAALEDPSALARRRIAFASHCFACTVGAGSG